MILIALIGNLHNGKENDVLNEILNGKATVRNEARALDSYTEDEIKQNPDLQNIFDEINGINISSTAHNNINIAYGNLYTSTVVTSYGDIVIYRSLPRVVLTVSDVGTAGSTDFNCKLEIMEYASVNGDMDTDWQNVIRYRDISGDIACGDNTAFTSSLKLSGKTASDKKNIIESILGADAFSDMTYSSDSEYNSDTNVTYERVYRADINNEELYDDTHYLKMMSSISTVDSGETKNQSTAAVSQWMFDVYLYEGALNIEYNDVEISCTTNYLVNMK